MNKFSLKVGDEVTLKEKYTDKTYLFKIAGDYKYDAAITVFIGAIILKCLMKMPTISRVISAMKN